MIGWFLLSDCCWCWLMLLALHQVSVVLYLKKTSKNIEILSIWKMENFEFLGKFYFSSKSETFSYTLGHKMPFNSSKYLKFNIIFGRKILCWDSNRWRQKSKNQQSCDWKLTRDHKRRNQLGRIRFWTKYQVTWWRVRKRIRNLLNILDW